MKPKQTLVLAVAIIVLATGVFLSRVIRMANGARTTLASATSRLNERDSLLRRFKQRVSVAERTNRELQSKLEDLRHAQTTVANGVKKRLNPVEKFFENPKLQAQYLAAKRTSIEAKYGPFFRAAGLSPELIKRCQDIIMEREESDLDILATVPAAASINYDDNSLSITPRAFPPGQVLSADQQAAVQLLQEQNEAFQTAQTEALGPQGYQQLQDYERTLPVRGVVDNIAGSLAITPGALTADQANQLTQILANASASYQRGEAADSWLGVDDFNWTQATAQAKAVLSPAQFEAFSAVTAPSRTWSELCSSIKAATSANSLPAEVPANGPHG